MGNQTLAKLNNQKRRLRFGRVPKRIPTQRGPAKCVTKNSLSSKLIVWFQFRGQHFEIFRFLHFLMRSQITKKSSLLKTLTPDYCFYQFRKTLVILMFCFLIKTKNHQRFMDDIFIFLKFAFFRRGGTVVCTFRL